jgi:ankyrin repeat protein
MDHPAPSPDDTEDLLLSCRYGDIDDVKSFIDRYGTDPVSDARDENGNNVLHMASANGHIGESIRAPTHPRMRTRTHAVRHHLKLLNGGTHRTTQHGIALYKIK